MILGATDDPLVRLFPFSKVLNDISMDPVRESTLCRQLCFHGQVECIVEAAARGYRGRPRGSTD
jgi:hypothetical protein